MSSSAERFWKAVDHWQSDQPPPIISLEFSGQRPKFLSSFRGIATSVDGKVVMFLDRDTNEEREVDFTNAEIRPHSFERIVASDSFAVRWEFADGGVVQCVLTVLLDFGMLN